MSAPREGGAILIPAAADRDRVGPRLYVGAHHIDVSWLDGFDVLVLCAEELQDAPEGAAERMKVLRCPLADDRPTRRERLRAWGAAQALNQERLRGRRVLVTCAQGVNRSAWVAALALWQQGLPASSAVATIRKRRTPRGVVLRPLCNEHFVAHLQGLEQGRFT